MSDFYNNDEIMDLYQVIDNRDATILELQSKLDAHESEFGGDYASERIDELTNEVEEGRRNILELESQVHDCKAKNDILITEKKNLEDQVKSQSRLLDAQRKRLLSAQKYSNDQKKEQKDESGEMYNLEVENQKLRTALEEIGENEEDLVSEIKLISLDKVSLEQKLQDQWTKDELTQRLLEEKKKTCDQLHKEKDLLQNTLDANQSRVSELLQKQAEDALKIDQLHKLNSDLLAEQQKYATTSSTGTISKNENVIALKFEVSELRTLLRENETRSDQLERDLESMCRALEDSSQEKRAWKEKFIKDEKLKSIGIEHELKLSKSGKDDILIRYNDLEEELTNLREELRCSEERNLKYEESHNLTDAIQYQKVLEADIRRRDKDIRELNILIGKKDDQLQFLRKKWEQLREHGISDLHDDEIESLIEIDESNLQFQNNELLRQINILEEDRNELMKRLRNNTVQIGEKGIRFLGLTAEQVVQVTDFASNLKQGNLDLPLNDASMKLNAELASLIGKRKNDIFTIERLEKEIIHMKSVDLEGSKHSSNEIKSMNHMLNNIVKQNESLRSQVESLKSQAYQSTDVKLDISPLLRKQIEDILGEKMVTMPEAGHRQFMLLIKEYEKLNQELSILKASMKKMSHSCLNNYKSDGTNVSIPMINSKMICNGDTLSIAGSENTVDHSVHTHPSKNEYKNNKSLEFKAILSKCAEIQVDTIGIYDKLAPEKHLDEKLRASDKKVQRMEKEIESLHNSLAKCTQKRKKCDEKIKITEKAVNQMKLLLNEKNKIIENERRRVDEAKGAMIRSREQTFVERSDIKTNDSNNRESQYLLQKLREASFLLREKDLMIKRVNLSLREYEQKEKNTSNRCDELVAKLRLMENQIIIMTEKNDQMENMKADGNTNKQVDQMEEQLNQKEKEIEHLKSLMNNESVCSIRAHDQANRDSIISKLKSSLFTARRAREMSDNALIVSKRSNCDAHNEINRLKSTIVILRREAIEAKQQHINIMNQLRKMPSNIDMLRQVNGNSSTTKDNKGPKHCQLSNSQINRKQTKSNESLVTKKNKNLQKRKNHNEKIELNNLMRKARIQKFESNKKSTCDDGS